MGVMRHYLARKLYLPSGEVLERHVVAVCNGCVVEWYPFETEFQSLLLVDDLYLCEGVGSMFKIIDSPL